MMSPRLAAAAKVAGWHFLLSVVVSLVVAAIVFGVWYPYPYRELSGGRELFWIVVAVDVVCGPLMTLILFKPKKSRRELMLDLGLVAAVQLSALCYGTWTTWQVRPSYLVFELDRFKVISVAALDPKAVKALTPDLAPHALGGVKTVAVRPPKSTEERNKVLFESIDLGIDYAERPDFYIPYEGEAARKSFERARPMETFFVHHPQQKALAEAISKDQSIALSELKYLPVMGRQDWVALLDKDGKIRGFLKGDGFL